MKDLEKIGRELCSHARREPMFVRHSQYLLEGRPDDVLKDSDVATKARPSEVHVRVELVGDISDEGCALGNRSMLLAFMLPVLAEEFVHRDWDNLEDDGSTQRALKCSIYSAIEAP